MESALRSQLCIPSFILGIGSSEMRQTDIPKIKSKKKDVFNISELFNKNCVMLVFDSFV